MDYKSTIEIQDKADKQDLIYDLLGGNPADLLMPRNFLIVEGESEYQFIRNVILRFYPSKKEIKVVKAFGDVDRAGKAIDAIEKIFTPLSQSLYADRVVILMDAINGDAMQASYDAFKKRFVDILDLESQVYFLPVTSIEEYYPEARDDQLRAQNDHLYAPKWKRTVDEISNMNGRQKVKLAKSISADIEPGQFEVDMKAIKEALDKCWDNAY